MRERRERERMNFDRKRKELSEKELDLKRLVKWISGEKLDIESESKKLQDQLHMS